MTLKSNLRRFFLEKRKKISLQRRREAALLVLDQLKNRGRLLSFYSFGSEIDLTPLNQSLVIKNCLYLPRIEKQELAIYQIKDLEKQVMLSSLGILEPNPTLCSKAQLTDVDCILVPGLAFDCLHYRLGYGRGYYDQLLAKASHISSIALGFQEQFYNHSLPRDLWDLPSKELLLC